MQTTYSFTEEHDSATLVKTTEGATLNGASVYVPILRVSHADATATILHGPNTNLSISLTTQGLPTTIAAAIDLLPLLPGDAELTEFLLEAAYYHDVPVAQIPIVGGTTNVFLVKQNKAFGWDWGYVLRGTIYTESTWADLINAMRFNVHDTYGRDTEGAVHVATYLADIMSWEVEEKDVITVQYKDVTLRRTRQGEAVIDEVIGTMDNFAPYIKMRLTVTNPPYIEELATVDNPDPNAWSAGIGEVYRKARL